MMIQVVPFEELHVKHLPPISESLLRFYLSSGENWTLLLDGIPVAAAGVLINGGIGTSWGLISDKAKTLPVALHKNVKRILGEIIARHGLRRVDVIANPAMPENVRWVEHLGFHHEGMMTDFYDVGIPAAYYARTTSEVR